MKKTHKKQLFRCGIITVIAFCLAFLLTVSSFNNNVATAGATSEVTTIYVGDVIDAENYKISIGGKSVAAQSMIAVYPSGGVYGGDSFQIDQAGKYQITYCATVDGTSVEETRNYLAIRRAKDLMILEDGMTAAYGDYYVSSPYVLKKGIKGTVVSFKAGQAVTFTSKIKTANLTKDYDILKLIVMPSVFNETDFERLTVMVADANDPSNYVEILIDSSNMQDGDGQVSYVKACANGQQYGGYEGKTYHTMNYGTQVEHSFRGLGHNGNDRKDLTVSEQILTVAIDNATRQIFCGPASATTIEKSMVNDLDDPTHFKSNPWHGFTSDEVTVKVTAGKFVKGNGKVVFTNIGDYDLSGDIYDELAPEITIDYDWSQPIPVAEVGKNFPLFDYLAKDGLDEQVKTNVWVYHVAKNGKRVTVNHDGEKFFAKYSGKYEIVYHAEDNSGNAKEQKLTINAVEKAESIVAKLGETYIEEEIYSEVNIALASQIEVEGGSGCLSVERTVLSPSGEELDVKERLLLTELGDYQVVYTVTDYLGNVESYPITIRVSSINAPKFVEEPSFESALIKGFTYAVPHAKVVETSNGNVVEVPCKVYVNEKLVEGSFVAESNTANIVYVAEGKTGTTRWERTLAVIDTENGKYKSRYFFTKGNIRVTDEMDNLKLSILGDSAAEFINSLGANSLNVKLRFDENAMNFNSMKFVLTDAQNKALSVTINFYYNQETKTWYMQLKDCDRVSYVTSKDIFTLKYIAKTGKIVDASGEEVGAIKSYDNGDAFQGFSSKVYFAIGFDGVYDNSTMYVEQLCNQVLGYSMSSIELATDDIKPVIELAETFVMSQKLNTKANIPAATAFDVLSQAGEVTVTVLGVDGETLYSGPANGNIDVTLSRAGYYLVTYRAKDSNGNNERLSFGINVNDETAPVLVVDNNLKSEYKVGDKIAIPSYSATDNDNVWYVQVTLLMPNNELRLLEYNDNGNITSLLSKDNQVYDDDFKTGDGGFIVKDTGRYVLRIVAYDDSYNYVATEIVFYVK